MLEGHGRQFAEAVESCAGHQIDWRVVVLCLFAGAMAATYAGDLTRAVIQRAKQKPGLWPLAIELASAFALTSALLRTVADVGILDFFKAAGGPEANQPTTSAPGAFPGALAGHAEPRLSPSAADSAALRARDPGPAFNVRGEAR